MTKDTLKVTVAGTTITVPILEDEKTTRKIIQDVNNRMTEIESTSARVDTQAFAIMAAVSFATELQHLKLDQQDETKDIVLALDSLSDSIQSILEDFDEPE